MSEPAILPTEVARGTGQAQVGVLLDIARSQVDEAYRISELLETKARNLIQWSSVFFAASQAAIGVQLAAASNRFVPSAIVVLACTLALIGLLALGAAVWFATRLQEPQPQAAIDVRILVVGLLPPAQRDDPRVPSAIARVLAEVVETRRDENGTKAAVLAKVQIAALVALGSSGTGLFLGLITAYSLR